MRKVAANYLFFPGYPLIKNGYVVLEQDQVKEVVDTGGLIREIQGLEFYAGILVAGCVGGKDLNCKAGEPLLPAIESVYLQEYREAIGVALIEGADLKTLTCRQGMRISLLR